jgi:hypothetical protein
MMSEIQQEAVITKRILERVPADKLSWRPHPKSMSLAELALHIAATLGDVSQLAQRDDFDVADANFNPPGPTDTKEFLTTLDASVKAAEEYLATVSDSAVMENWRLTSKAQRTVRHPPGRRASNDHAQPLVPPPRAVVSLSSAARRAGSGDLRSQCRRRPICLRRSTKHKRSRT